MSSQLVTLLTRKLEDELRAIDDATENEIRQAWEQVGPQPSCPFISELMGRLQTSCATGFAEREGKTLRVIEETIAPVRDRLKKKSVDDLVPVLQRLFPEDKYIALVGQTPEVYSRRQADDKFQATTFQIQYSALRALSANRSRETVRRVRLYLDEQLLQLQLTKLPWWKVLWSGMQPALKWTFGIAAAVLTAALLAHFGLK